eukprot:scaffold14621_cov40-Cyclotella_meneghiniana.AAC.2
MLLKDALYAIVKGDSAKGFKRSHSFKGGLPILWPAGAESSRACPPHSRCTIYLCPTRFDTRGESEAPKAKAKGITMLNPPNRTVDGHSVSTSAFID